MIDWPYDSLDDDILGKPPSLRKVFPDAYHSCLKDLLPEMHALHRITYGAPLPPTKGNESSQQGAIDDLNYDPSTPEQPHPTLSQWPSLDKRQRQWQEAHKQIISDSNTGGHDPTPILSSVLWPVELLVPDSSIPKVPEPLVQKPAVIWINEGQKATDVELEPDTFQEADNRFLDEYRKDLKRSNEHRARNAVQRIQEAICAGRMRCCHCETWGKPAGGECIETDCQHGFCRTCRDQTDKLLAFRFDL